MHEADGGSHGGTPLIIDDEHRRRIREGRDDSLEETPRVDRRAQIAHVAAEHVVERVEQLATATPLDECALIGLANWLRTLRSRGSPLRSGTSRKSCRHCADARQLGPGARRDAVPHETNRGGATDVRNPQQPVNTLAGGAEPPPPTNGSETAKIAEQPAEEDRERRSDHRAACVPDR